MEDVPFQIGLVTVSVMMEITMKNAIMMVVTAVDQMSIQITAQFVNALNEGLRSLTEYNFDFSFYVVVIFILSCMNKPYIV